MNTVYLQLGSNLGDRNLLIKRALELINNHIGKILQCSRIYESTPWGVDGQDKYLNQAVQLKTNLIADDILSEIHDIEKKLGRVRVEKWGERLIDIDIIFYNNDIIENKNLCIPHKHMHQRNFVLIPMSEIAADIVHPKYNKTVAELLVESQDIEKVSEYEI
tara:strand:+ start:34 stop:519 length:486 start_codon:yes stop_codon:yes gene_type:complete